MSLPRLPFLYPQFFRTPKSWEAYATFGSLSPPTRKAPRRGAFFHHNSRRRQETTYAQRYGPAAEGLPPPTNPADTSKSLPPPAKEDKVEKSSDVKAAKTKPGIGSSARTSKEKEKEEPQSLADDVKETLSDNAAKNNIPEIGSDIGHPSQPPSVSSLNTEQQSIPQQLDNVLHMEAPTVSKSEDTKPHLQPTPYVHHFDSYTLVKDLTKGGFSQKHSVTMMKAVRGLLAENLDIAKEGLVSNSDVENETYLFRAACSELRTEITNSRRRAADSMRSERGHLQHEVDILSQRLTQEAGALKDDLKGMFDDRKMAVRMEQRNMESKIQELNYKITVHLLGESKGEVEGLRWFLTRRAAMFIGGMALLTLGYLRYSTFVSHQEQEERKRIATSSSTGSGSHTIPSRSAGTQTAGIGTDAVMASMEEGKEQGISYVSLG